MKKKKKKLKDQAIVQLSAISKDESKSPNLLTNLVAQTLYRLVEKEAHIKCREKDLSLVKVSFMLFFMYQDLNMNMVKVKIVISIQKNRMQSMKLLNCIKSKLNAKSLSKYCLLI